MISESKAGAWDELSKLDSQHDFETEALEERQVSLFPLHTDYSQVFIRFWG